MKIKMKAIAAGPDGVFNLGNVYDLPEKQAQAFIAGKYAVAYTESVKANSPVIEVNTLEEANLAHKAAEEAYNDAKDALGKAKKEDRAKAGKILAAAKKSLHDAEAVLKKQEEIASAK